jgi:hypothetical protein
MPLPSPGAGGRLKQSSSLDSGHRKGELDEHEVSDWTSAKEKKVIMPPLSLTVYS